MTGDDLPIVSVVTISFNASDEIEATIESVLEQSYSSVDYVIVDGGSTDGTVAKIKKFDAQISAWQSEPDRGIYDAMNKGVRLAKGHWIVFMNAGDRFYSEHALRDILSEPLTDRDILYGDHEARYTGGYSRIVRSKDSLHLWKGMVCSHQAMLCHRDLLLHTPFNTSNSITADFEFLAEQCARGKRIERRNVVVATILADGISDRARGRVFLEYFRIARRHWPGVKTTVYYTALILWRGTIQFAKRLMPSRLWEKAASLKHRALRRS